MSKTRELIINKCDEIKNLLLAKNEAYGDSALNPTKIFSRLDSSEALKVRIDDKMTRIMNKGLGDETEDTCKDLAGYLILLMISEDIKNNKTKGSND